MVNPNLLITAMNPTKGGRVGITFKFLRILGNLKVGKTASECDFGPELGLLLEDSCHCTP